MFAALVDAVVKPHDHLRVGRVARRIAKPDHLRIDQPGILAEFNPAGERRIIRNDGERLPGRCRQASFKAFHFGIKGLGAGRNGKQRQRRQKGSKSVKQGTGHGQSSNSSCPNFTHRWQTLHDGAYP